MMRIADGNEHARPPSTISGHARHRIIIDVENRNTRRKSSADQLLRAPLHLLAVNQQPRGNMAELSLKVLFLGDWGCGKKSIVERIVHNTFTAREARNTGIEFDTKNVQWAESITVRLVMSQISEYWSHSRCYADSARAEGIFLILDFSRPFNMEHILYWKDAVDDLRRVSMAQDTLPVILLANKSDIPRHASVPPMEQLCAFAASHGFTCVVETSAKDAMHRVCPSFHHLLKITCTAGCIHVSLQGINEAVSLMVKLTMANNHFCIPSLSLAVYVRVCVLL
jgi:GTPase SAR1 family protein